MTQKFTQMRLVRYLFTTVLALLFVNCSKGRSSDEPKPYTQGEHTPSSKQTEDEISSNDYELSADGLTLIKWHNHNTKNLDMNRDTRLRKVKEIGNYAFEGLNLTSINISSSTTSIGVRAFLNCRSLTSINIPNSVTAIERAAFAYCTGLTSINIPSSVTTIGVRAFFYCRNLTSINIPNSVTSIGERAFIGCRSLMSINIPNSVTSIEEYAFADCSNLTSVVFEGSNPPRVTKITDMFENTPSNLKLIVPKGAKSAYIKARYPEDKLVEQ